MFLSQIRSLGVYRNKHIPVLYLRSSVEQRTQLLRGLMDTDGHIDPRGLVTIDLCNENLARGLVELVRSLGGPCNNQGETGHAEREGSRKALADVRDDDRH